MSKTAGDKPPPYGVGGIIILAFIVKMCYINIKCFINSVVSLSAIDYFDGKKGFFFGRYRCFWRNRDV